MVGLDFAILWVIIGMTLMGFMAIYCAEKWFKYRRLYRKYKAKEGKNAILREVLKIEVEDNKRISSQLVQMYCDYGNLHKKYEKILGLYNETQHEKISKGEVKYVRQ